MDHEKIGQTAGVVWQFLRESAPSGTSMASLKKIDGIKSDEAVAAIGWLAREGKLAFTLENRGRLTISLNESDHWSAV